MTHEFKVKLHGDKKKRDFFYETSRELIVR
jgi:hypothetical protein